MSEFEKYELKKRERKNAKKEAGRLKREKDKKMANMSEAEIKKLEKYR